MDDLEKPPELIDDVLDKLNKLMERWNDRLTMNNLRLAERYFKAKLHILVHFRVGGIDEEFVAHLQRVQIVGGFKEQVELREDRQFPRQLRHVPQDVGTDVNAPEGRPNGYQQAVLVGVIQFMEHPELMSLPTLVRLDRANRFYSGLRQALYFSGAIGFVFRGSVLNRKVDMAAGIAGCKRADHEELEREMVQGAAEAVNGVASENGEASRRVPDARDIVDWFSRVRIALGPDFIRVGVEECADDAIQVMDVLFGPFDFRPDAEQLVRRWCGHDCHSEA